MTLREPTLSANARTIFDLRYSRKDADGNPTETPAQTIDRVVMNVASVNALYPPYESAPAYVEEHGDFEQFPYKTARRQYEWLQLNRWDTDEDFGAVIAGGWYLAVAKAEQYREMLTERRFFPNSPTWTGAGTPLGQLAACFVLPIDDDLATGRASIFETLKVAALIQQTGGGNGFSFGRLRPSNAVVTRSMGRASGPMGFLRVYDGGFGEIAQGGSRRGANMGVLPVSHPDVREFIRSKTVEGKIANFNISVAITDEFMEAVEKDADFELKWGLHSDTDDPVSYTITETVRAKELYDEIINNAWVIGDPGNLFIDRANRDNPVPTRYTLEATNPCGEQWLGPYENCCLGSIAVNRFASWDRDGRDAFDWEAFRQTVVLATQFLDDVVDANQYVPAVPELEAAAQGGRRIGLGLMGVSDAMAMMGLRYGSREGNEFMAQVTEFARYWSMLASIERAGERGTFEWFENSIYDLSSDEPIMGVDGKPHQRWTPPTPLEPYTHDFGRPDVWWGGVVDLIKEKGIRNSCTFTFAPTGTISNVADLEGSGCEPFFALAFDRLLMQDGQNIKLAYASPLFHEALVRAGKTEAEIADIAVLVKANKGSCQGIEQVPLDVQHAFPVAADLTPEEHVIAQATLQRFVDNSISKTINMPKSATPKDVSDAYMLAYRLGCKGITVYRQGSREVEVLTTGTVETLEAEEWPIVKPVAIPDYAEYEGLPTRTFPVATPFGTAQVYVTELRDHIGRPFDVRIGFGKAGNDKLADVEAIGRMISMALRGGVGVEYLVDQLEGIGGQAVFGFGDKRVRSVADGVGKLLRRLYLDAPADPVPVEVKGKQSHDEEAVLDPDRVCPHCHNATLVMISGCRTCSIALGGCGDYSGCE